MLHYNNNNSLNIIEGNKNKAKGVVAGVSDFEFVGYDEMWFIELKLPGGQQSMEQRVFESMVIERGHRYKLIYSLEQFKALICQIIGRY